MLSAPFARLPNRLTLPDRLRFHDFVSVLHFLSKPHKSTLWRRISSSSILQDPGEQLRDRRPTWLLKTPVYSVAPACSSVLPNTNTVFI
ncbi:unnamed protein product [Arctogadus glacialis]